MMGSAILQLCSFSSPGRDQMLGFVQKHRAQSQSPKFFLIHITHFRVIGVPGGCLASSSLFLDEDVYQPLQIPCSMCYNPHGII